MGDRLLIISCDCSRKNHVGKFCKIYIDAYLIYFGAYLIYFGALGVEG
jgi:hypothetical protein